MNYNERNPTFSFRLGHLFHQRLTKMAKLNKESTNEHARTIISKYLKGELVEKKLNDPQEKLMELRIKKLEAEIKYMEIKNKFAENFNQPMSQRAQIAIKPMIMGESQKNWKSWEQKTQNPQSPYDAKNKRLQCIDCGTLFTWQDYQMYNIAIQEFQRHLVAKHNRVKTEIEKDVLLNLEYEGASE
jgi:hypothetical protein